MARVNAGWMQSDSRCGSHFSCRSAPSGSRRRAATLEQGLAPPNSLIPMSYSVRDESHREVMHRSFSRDPKVALLRKQGGQWLKTLRTHAGLSQRELANMLGLEYYTFVSQLENGIGRIPPERYENWANALDVPVQEFVRQILCFYDPFTYDLLFTGGRRKKN